MIEIKNKVISYKNTKVLSGLDDLIILHHDFLEFKWQCIVEKTDDGVPMEKKYQGQKTILKKAIIGCDAYWSNNDERFCASIIVQGGDDSVWMCETMKEAVAIKSKIQDWLLL